MNRPSIKKRNRKMEFSSESNISLKLFDFLCKLVGSEKDVRARRIFFKVLDHAIQYSPEWRVVTSGSKSEGLDLPGSDLDIMYINQVDTVYNTQSEIPNDLPYGLFLDFENTPPGYVHIKLHLNSKSYMNTQHLYSDSNILLINGYYKRLIQSMYVKENMATEFVSMLFTDIHGPCSSSISGSYDFLSTYKCHSWPIVASEWITRSRLYEWPRTELIEDIVRDNVLLAPIGSKFNNKKDNPYEWRMSFSIAEKMLVHSFNHTQILCYALLKYTLKEVINRKIQGIVCSYFMKTVLFWMIEESQISVWQPYRLFECFSECIKRLFYFVQNNFLPNYFIPHNNLIEGMTNDQKKLLLSVFTNGKQFLRQIQTLSSFFYNSETPFGLSRTKHSNLDSIIYPLLHYMHGIGFGWNHTIYQPIYCIMSHRKCKLLKKICFLWFSKFCGSLAKHHLLMLWEGSNAELQNHKQNISFYLNYKKCLWFTILGTFSDSYTGWLLLAEFFFKCNHLENTLQLIQLCQLKSMTDHQIITPDLKPYPRSEILEKNGLNFLQRYKHSCSDLFYFIPQTKPHIMFFIEDIYIPFFEKEMVIIHPQIQMYYLLFLCHHYQGNKIEKWKALRLLNDFTLQCKNSRDYMNGMTYLGKAITFVDTIPGFLLTDLVHHYCKSPFVYTDYLSKQFKPLMRGMKNITGEMLQPLVDEIPLQYERDSMPPVLKTGLRLVSNFWNI